MMRIEGVEPVLCRSDERKKVLGIGSIIKFTLPVDIVWGSGTINKDHTFSSKADFRCVRDPITASIVTKLGGRVGLVGSAALCLPITYIPPKIGGSGDCYLAHYADLQDARKFTGGKMDIVSPLNSNPSFVIADIVRHDMVFSSSLHGVIVAHAYGVPAVWIRQSDRLGGDGTKFEGYYESLGLQCKVFPTITEEAREKAKSDKANMKLPDIKAIWDCRPWK
jgi:hypothetical protein